MPLILMGSLMKLGTKLQGCTSGILTIGGMVLSGNTAVWGACAAGHEPKAPYPFPDLMGTALFLLGLTAVPLVVAMCVARLRRVSAAAPFVTAPLSNALGILIFAPLLSWVIGYGAQLPFSRKLTKERNSRVAANLAYGHYVAQNHCGSGDRTA